MSRADRNLHVVMALVAIPLGLILAVWVGCITVTAFIGGQAPFFFIEFDGFSLIRGLFWLVVIDPIIATVAYWIFMVVVVPLGGMASALGDRQDRNHPPAA